jgi:hypothetical protein
MAILKLRSMAKQDEKIYCALVFHVLKLMPNICPAQQEKLTYYLASNFISTILAHKNHQHPN